MPKKAKTEIQLGSDYNFQILHKKDDAPTALIKESIKNKLSKLEHFYQFKITTLEIELVYSRKEFNEIVGRETPAWLVALSKANKIYIFSPKALKKHSSHEKSELEKTIIHELAHVFNYQINENCPLWLDEGLALYLAGQRKGKDFSKENWNYFLENYLDSRSNLDDFADREGYKISYNLVKRILKRKGKAKLIELLK